MLLVRHLLAIVFTVAVASAASPPAPRPYVYRVVEHTVTDGDTIKAKLDLGFEFEYTLSARLQNIDAPEISTPAGKAVREFVAVWAAKQQTILFESISRDKYAGRYVAKLHGDNEELGELLLAKRLAKSYDGKTKAKWADVELTRIERAAREATLALQSADQEPGASGQIADADTESLFGEPSSFAPRSTVTVYVTDTGQKYHAANCRHLDDSKRAISLDEAKKNYKPCKHCNP